MLSCQFRLIEKSAIVRRVRGVPSVAPDYTS